MYISMHMGYVHEINLFVFVTTLNHSYFMKQLRHMDTRHFVILECRHLANGCVLKCGCIGLMLFRNISCLGTIICYINTIGIIPAYACNVLNGCD